MQSEAKMGILSWDPEEGKCFLLQKVCVCPAVIKVLI